jgi:hypothetical protein
MQSAAWAISNAVSLFIASPLLDSTCGTDRKDGFFALLSPRHPTDEVGDRTFILNGRSKKSMDRFARFDFAHAHVAKRARIAQGRHAWKKI